QRGRGSLGLVRVVGPRSRGSATRHRRGDGLDGFRSRQSVHARASSRHAPRKSHAAALADRRQGRIEGPAQCSTGTGRRELSRYGSFRFLSTQSHTAGNLAIEVIVTYPFHPRHGQRVPVTGVKRHAGADHLIARQPDGTLSLLPVWMTRPEAGAYQLVATPHLPIGVLFDLRGLIDALLASSRGDSPLRGGDHAHPTPSN